MHFHVAAICANCHLKQDYETPIPNVLIQASMCPRCGWWDLIGRDVSGICADCMDDHTDRVSRDVVRDMRRR
jgi:nitrous oxide reductase accessory protein NosL